MNCRNCPYNNQGGGGQSSRPVIRHTQGNYLQLSIPITIRWHIVTDGVEQKVEKGSIDRNMGISVILTNGKHEHRYEPEIYNNQVTILDRGTLTAGTYNIIIEIEDNGAMLRYKKRTLLQIVDSTEDGQQYENNEMNVLAIYPIVEGVTTAIIVGDDDVVISENGKYKGDDTPNDDNADITAQYGESSIEVGDDEVIINL